MGRGPEGQKWLWEVWLPSGQPPEPERHPLMCLKNNQEMYSSGCATGSTGAGAPVPGLPRVVPGLCLSLARGSGPEGQAPVQGSTRDSQTSLPTPPELGRAQDAVPSRAVRCVSILGPNRECPELALHSVTRSNYDRSPAATRHSCLPTMAGCLSPAPRCLLAWWGAVPGTL